MPRRYVKSRKTFRRTSKKTQNRRRKAVSKARRSKKPRTMRMGFSNSKNFLAKKCYTKHVYSETVTLDGTSGGVKYVEYGLNDIHDPRIATGGHQPYGTDFVKSAFDNSHVVGGSIEATFYSAASSSNQLATCPVCFVHVPRVDADGTTTDGITLSDTASLLCERGIVNPQRKSKHLQHNYAGKPTVLKRKFSTRRIAKDFMRESSHIVACPDLGAKNGYSPAKVLNCQIGMVAAGDAAFVDTVVLITITYFVLWTDPTVMGQS